MTKADRLMERCFSELKEYCSENSPHHFIFLSGGIDSFTVLAALMQTHKPENVTAIIIKGITTQDFLKAKKAAEFYGVNISICEVCVNSLMQEVPYMTGTKDTSLFQSLFRLTAIMALRKVNVSGCLVHTGDGADSLYGNARPFIYLQTPEISKKHNVSNEVAREIIRVNWRKHVMAGKATSTTTGIIASVIKSFGGFERQAFVTGKFEYLLEVPMSLFQGDKKTWVKQGLVRHFNVPKQIAFTRQRESMQEGTGMMKHFGASLCKLTGCKTANAAVRILSR